MKKLIDRLFVKRSDLNCKKDWLAWHYLPRTANILITMSVLWVWWILNSSIEWVGRLFIYQYD